MARLVATSCCAAATAFLCLVAHAPAEIIHVDLDDPVADRDFVRLDIDADGVNDFTIFRLTNDFRVTIVQGLDESRGVALRSSDRPFAALLAPGEAISEDLLFRQSGWLAEEQCDLGGSSCAWFGPFTQLEQPGFIGFEFLIDEMSHFGWIRAKASSFTGAATIFDFAFETRPGVSIRAGQIPAPASAWLFAAAALATRRRR